MGKLIVSIITVVYNAHSTLESTIKSVIDQERNEYEYWIIDGGSTDGTLDMIRKYEDRITGWVSEPDKGIYDAMNKAVRYSSGEWLLFLGSGDLLLPGAVTSFLKLENKKYAMIYGSVKLSNGKEFLSEFNWKLLFWNTIHHQGAFYRRSIFDCFAYDVDLKIMSDYELNLRLFVQRQYTYKLPFYVSMADVDGISSRFWQPMYEIIQIHDKVFNNKIMSTTLNFTTRVYYGLVVIKFAIGKYLFKRSIPADLNI